MKLRFLILIVLLAVMAPPVIPQGAPKPLTRAQLLDLVKAGMETQELVKLIREHSVDFDLTEAFVQALRSAGAQDPVIEALRAAHPKPLSKEQVLQLVAGHVPSERAAILVSQHGIDFIGDEAYFETLRLAGANDTLIAALREASKAVRADLVVVTSPEAEVFLDFQLQGRADAQGELTVKALPGSHALKVTHSSKKAFEQNVTLTVGLPTRIEARMEDLGPTPGQVRVNPTDGLKYVWIPPGTFMMGCSPGDNECFDSERPTHAVTISKGFWIGQTPATVGAFKRFAAATGRAMPPEPSLSGRALNAGWANDAMPMVNVTWNDAAAFCRWAGGRLPGEAEWEYAARGGSTEARYGPVDEIAWYAGDSGGERLDNTTQLWNAGEQAYYRRLLANDNRLHEVGLKRGNGFGLFDMLGSALEWVSDWYDEHYYQSSPSEDPTGPASGQARILRGGAWDSPAAHVRASIRHGRPPNNYWFSFSFRCGGDVFGP